MNDYAVRLSLSDWDLVIAALEADDKYELSLKIARQAVASLMEQIREAKSK